jgi:hypothetical protein
MANLQCPACGNTRQWSNITLNSSGASATCGVCGSAVVDPSTTSSGSFYLDNVTTSGETVIGDHQVVVGQSTGAVDPAWQEAARAAREAGRAAREAGRAARQAAREQRRAAGAGAAGQPGPPPSGQVFDGPVAFGANNVVVGPGAQAFGPGSRAVDTSARPEPPRRDQPTDPRPPQPPPARPDPPSAPTDPVPAPTGGPDPDARPAATRPDNTGSTPPSTGAAPQSGTTGATSATAPGGGEVTSLPSAMRYAHSMGTALAGQAQHVEIFVGTLRASQVSGAAVTAALRAQELTTAAAAAWAQAHDALNRQTIVREAYGAAPESGTKGWLTNG